MAACSQCGEPRAVTDEERKGGLSPRQTQQRLQKRAEHEATPGMGRVTVRADGLAIRLTSPRGRRQWWCRWCDGNKPEPWRIGKASSLEAVFPEWDMHRQSETHQRELSVRRAADETVDAVISHVLGPES